MPDDVPRRRDKEELIAELGDLVRGAKLESHFNLETALRAAGQGFGGTLTILIPNASERAATRTNLARSCDISWQGRNLYVWDTGTL